MVRRMHWHHLHYWNDNSVSVSVSVRARKKSSQLVSMHEQMMLKTDECRLEPFTSWMTIHAISNSSSFFALSSMRQCTFVVKNAKERVQTRDAMISARKEGNVLTWIHVRGTLVLCVLYMWERFSALAYYYDDEYIIDIGSECMNHSTVELKQMAQKKRKQ